MKYRLYSAINLMVIVFYLLRPSMPYIEYILNKEYIEKNLCVERSDPENSCHGKCYLNDQLNRQSEPADNNENNKIVPDNKMDDHLKEAPLFSGLNDNGSLLSSYYSVSDTYWFIYGVFIPPESQV